jgi:DNA-binding transcriptional regulator YiaG
MKPIQCVMARVGMQLSRQVLAKLAGVSTATIYNFETGKMISQGNVLLIRQVLASKGVIFDVNPPEETANYIGVLIPSAQEI